MLIDASGAVYECLYSHLLYICKKKSLSFLSLGLAHILHSKIMAVAKIHVYMSFMKTKICCQNSI